MWTHGYSQADAREAALVAPRGDRRRSRRDGLEEISDDDSIFDLIAERDVSNAQEFYERVDDFDTDAFIPGNSVDKADDSLAGDIDIEIFEAVPMDNVNATDVTVDDVAENAERHSVSEMVDDSGIHVDPAVQESNAEDGEILDGAQGDDVIIISSDEEEVVSDRAVVVSNSRTETQTLVLTFVKTCRYVNDVMVESSVTMERQFYYN